MTLHARDGSGSARRALIALLALFGAASWFAASHSAEPEAETQAEAVLIPVTSSFGR